MIYDINHTSITSIFHMQMSMISRVASIRQAFLKTDTSLLGKTIGEKVASRDMSFMIHLAKNMDDQDYRNFISNPNSQFSRQILLTYSDVTHNDIPIVTIPTVPSIPKIQISMSRPNRSSNISLIEKAFESMDISKLESYTRSMVSNHDREFIDYLSTVLDDSEVRDLSANPNSPSNLEMIGDLGWGFYNHH